MSNIAKFAAIYSPITAIEKESVEMFRNWSLFWERYCKKQNNKIRICDEAEANRLYSSLKSWIFFNSSTCEVDPYITALNILDYKDLIWFFSRDNISTLVTRYGFGDFAKFTSNHVVTCDSLRNGTTVVSSPANNNTAEKVTRGSGYTRDRWTYKNLYKNKIPNGITLNNLMTKKINPNYIMVAYDAACAELPRAYVFNFDTEEVRKYHVDADGSDYLRDAVRDKYCHEDCPNTISQNVRILSGESFIGVYGTKMLNKYAAAGITF